MKYFLVTGGTGQIGTALKRTKVPRDITLITPRRDELDLINTESIRTMMQSRIWDGVIHLAAYTAVDQAEEEVEIAWQLNAVAPAMLAKAAAALDIPILHVSTDYVFSGDLARPYRETDAIGPQGVYGASKESGEQAIRLCNPRHLIIRTSWVFSPYRQNFLKTMLRLAAERDVINVVADQVGTPTSADDVAAVILSLMLRLSSDANTPTGTFHFSNGGEASWSELAEAIFECSAALGGPTARVIPIATADYPTRAVRPQNSRLDASAIETAFGVARRPWRLAVQNVVKEILSGVGS